jgi:hypothetical protein
MKHQHARQLRRAGLAVTGVAAASLSVGFAGVGSATAATGAVSAAATSANVKLTNPTSGPSVVFNGGLGNANNVRVFKEDGQIAITDNVAITVGDGCRVVSFGKALCNPTLAGRSVRSVFVSLNDLNDAASVEAAFSGQVFGDGGDDFMRAGQGDVSGTSAITYNGGPGFDSVSYSRSPVSVKVTLDDLNNDGGGFAGGRDNIRDDVERVSGSELGDTLTGDERRNSFLGLGGNDTINPAGSVDEIFAGTGADVLQLRDGFVDVADGGPDSDRATIDRSFDSVTGVETIS